MKGKKHNVLMKVMDFFDRISNFTLPVALTVGCIVIFIIQPICSKVSPDLQMFWHQVLLYCLLAAVSAVVFAAARIFIGTENAE